MNPFNFSSTGFRLTEVGEDRLDEVICPDFRSGEIVTAGLTLVDGSRTSVSADGPASIGLYGRLSFAGGIPTITVTRPRFRLRRKNRAPITTTVDTLGRYHWAAEVSGPKPYTVHVSTPSQKWERHLV
jgi:hypothetical protein